MTPQALTAAPPEVSEALSRLEIELTAAAGKNLVSLALYGGLARGRFRPGHSDVNVVVVLADVSAASLQAVAGPLKRARRAAAIEPMILGRDEIASTALDFPTKFLDIREHHVVLAGTDPLAEIAVPREAIAARVAQELRNLLLRFRQRFVAANTDAASLRLLLVNSARPLAIQLAALLRLAGAAEPEDDRTATIFAAAANRFGLDRGTLQILADLRQQPDSQQDVVRLAADVLDNVALASRAAEELKRGMP